MKYYNKLLEILFNKKRSNISPCVNDAMFENNKRYLKLYYKIMKPKYLVRPHDYHIFDLDESNGCYRLWSTREVTYGNGERPNAMLHFTFENLTENYDFFPIDEKDIEIYIKKHEEYHDFVKWQTRSDGHGGIKGGTHEEYLKQLK